MNTMITTNRAQLAAAIRAVDPFTATVIQAVNEAGKTFCQYTFPKRSKPNDQASNTTIAIEVRKHERRLRKMAGNVLKTPAAYWR